MLACRRRHADDISDSTPSCSSPLLSTCDTEESGESSEDSESTSPRRTFRVKLQKQDLKRVQRDQKKVGGSQGDAMQIDSAIGFENVGGLSEHIAALKEMVIFPLLYPEVFQRFNIQSPRGCLFYGPPGTGKTLVARALANEYSRSDRKIPFFMRSASDCMRKYVGESERQLRVLFEQAYQMRPSIIFFDEIDGLAPVRSSKQDHIHSSIVSTLLTLLDGIVNRGEIVVIGATNRLDSIDPALRRPGRFDREFLFNLPNKEVRTEIQIEVDQTLEVLPVAPPAEPQKPQEEEVGMLEEKEEDTLRELRIFLRDVTHRLATDRRFREFAKPVDPQKVPDCATRIKEPMDLSTVLTQIDSRQYLTAGDYLKDIDLICNNALEYYPDQRSTDRHRAYVLQDTAYSMVRNEIDTEFGRLCEQIKESHEKRGRTSPVCAPWDDSKSPQQNPATEDDKPDEESNENEEMTAAPVDASTPISNGASERKRRRNNCARAAAKRSSQFDKENRVPTDDQNDSDEEEFVDKHVSDICQVKLNTEKESAKLCGYSTPRWGTITNENPSSNDSWAFQAVTPERSWEEDQQQISDENPVQVPTETDYIVIVDRYELKKLLCFVTEITKGFDIYHLEKVYGVINQCIYNHREDYDKTDLVEVTFVLNSSTFCHCYTVFVCSGISWLFSIALYCLGVCAQTTTTV
ncbi:ATPase family AAA domain-containing protein 2-like [Anas platyrhynchos]|uniref:ATPase family AAA domain-containing protein 2-like n=1 Tax=Anas platyrhynchos TaxID=8839 RepID=UPI003AF307A9